MQIKAIERKNQIQKILSKMSVRNVYASDEAQTSSGAGEPSSSTQPPTQSSTPTQTSQPTQKSEPTLNYEDLIAKARQDEKSKLYPEINNLKLELNNTVKRCNELLLKIGQKDEKISLLESELEKAKKGKVSTDEVKTLKTTNSELEQQVKNLQQELSSTKLNAFKEKEIAKCDGKVIPELVVGSTEEEIIQSIENAKNRYAEIVGQVSKTNNASASQTPPIANPSYGNMGIISNSNYSDEAIRDMSIEEYAKYRKQLGL